MLPNDVSPWELVYQQTQRSLKAGCFENMVCDLRSIIRVAQGRQGQPSAVILDGRTMRAACESGPRANWRACKAMSAMVKYDPGKWGAAAAIDRNYEGGVIGSPLPSSWQTDTRAVIDGYIKFDTATIFIRARPRRSVAS